MEVGKPLIGLGPGLTPSGDDFLGGMLFALWHLNSAYPSQFRHDTDSIGNLLEYASSQTNQISYAILTDFTIGQGPLPFHDLVEAMLTGRPISKILDCVRLVIAIGHSSGWDMLAGFILGMTITAPRSVTRSWCRGWCSRRAVSGCVCRTDQDSVLVGGQSRSSPLGGGFSS